MSSVAQMSETPLPRPGSPSRFSQVHKHYGGTAIKILLLVILLIPTLFPMYWITISSFKTNLETHSVPVTFLPKVWSLDTYREVFERRNFSRYLFNSMVVALATTAWGVFVAAWSGYGFARFNFRYKPAVMAFVLLAQSFPRILLVIPYFQLANKFGLKDSYLGLILAYSTFIQPLCLWIMKEYFEQIPRELDEAAMVDGASPYRAFWDVILPLARPALGATAIIGFLTAWNEYEFALVLTTSEKVRTISVAIASFIGEFTTEWNQVMAAAAIGTVPVIIVFLFFQKQLMQGLTGGAVKG
jgi:ABC-type glycerol-3-phosphate transport system permease component